MRAGRLPGIAEYATALVTLGFALACVAFARQPGLATFADDSVSYLVMAQVFSPWQPAAPAVAEAFAREAFYPPLLPLLLAAVGAAGDFGRAQALNAVLTAACLPLVYALGTRWLEDRRAALAATVAVAALPSLWIHAKGVLSEPLFTLLLLAALWALERKPARVAAVALALAALAMTRTVGLALAAAYAAWALWHGGPPVAARLRSALPALAPALAYAAWVALRPAQTADANVALLLERGSALAAGDAGAGLLASVARQANALGEAWIGSLMLYWVEGRPLRPALGALAGVLALAGLALRLRAGRADAWLAGAYLAVFLAWPFHEQMLRFLAPALPVLVLYAFVAAGALGRALGGRAGLAQGLVALLLLSLSAPALAFVHQRAGLGGPESRITDWYRTPGLEEARARARVQLGLMADMEAIRALTEPGARVMWGVPGYIALLADRRGVAAPPARLAPAEYRERVRAAAPDYVFLSRYHPRATIHDTAWRAGLEALAGHCRVVHLRTLPEGTTVDSMLLKC